MCVRDEHAFLSNFDELIVLQTFAAHDRDKREPTRGPVNEFEH